MKKKTTANQSEKRTPAKPHEILLYPQIQNAITMAEWGKYAGDVDLSELTNELHEQTKKVKDGDLSSLETMLYAQAQALQSIFTSLARRSALNAGQYLDASEKFMKLALKAQAQCRATLETLAIVKNPQPYIKQANIAHGPQQVNNGTAPRAENSENQQNKLLEAGHGSTYLDGRAAAATAGGHPEMEAVEQVNRPNNGGR